ncbi:cyclopropane fatty acyl phospholipid synthase [Cucumibacter marinus]|uniref:cyclopropane fatty acyl phospholipid synthase n=1 Tax=Cucumibacter marinus TaxID=1121252 RepID=UPI0003FDBBA2|nr:cyclopropane fatty acyl phospholipid synthase [Cucumibacter marinus]
MTQEAFITGLLADVGITVNGSNPWDPQMKNPDVWSRLYAHGSVGLGEAYMDGWWECEDLAEFFNRVIGAGIQDRLRITPNLIWQHLQARLLNMQNLGRSKRVAQMHYNQTEAYLASLDARVTGSCGYWPEGVENVDQAQEAKLDMVCRKVGLKPGDRVWDIGCGWGAFMGFAAEKYGADCVGVTVSPDQAAYGRERYKDLSVEFQVKDYREFDEKVDHIVSMGMFEHVGYKNYRTYFETARRAIKDDGLFMLHTIGSPDSTTTIDPWIEKYIFPGGVLPSLTQIGKAIEDLFVVIDLHNIGPHYDKTLVAWNENFQANWPAPKTDDEHRFKRMWEYYLLCCAGGFRSRIIQVWQFVLSTRGVPEGYVTQR